MGSRSKKMGSKKGEVIARQKDNITVMKWRDKRDIVMISTCHDASMQMSSGYQPKLKQKSCSITMSEKWHRCI